MTSPPPSDPNAGLRTAGTFAIWLWVVITLIPVGLIVLCVFLCGFSSLMGSTGGNR